MGVNMPWIHPLIEQIDGLTLAGAFDARDQDQHRKAALLLEVVLGVEQCLAQLCFLAAVGGLIQIPGAWELLSDWLDPVAEPLVEPSVLQDYATSAVSVAIGLAGIGVAWAIYGTHRLRIPKAAWLFSDGTISELL